MAILSGGLGGQVRSWDRKLNGHQHAGKWNGGGNQRRKMMMKKATKRDAV